MRVMRGERERVEVENGEGFRKTARASRVAVFGSDLEEFCPCVLVTIHRRRGFCKGFRRGRRGCLDYGWYGEFGGGRKSGLIDCSWGRCNIKVFWLCR
jgi:hypothetical protein